MNENLENIQGYAKRLAKAFPGAEPGLELIVEEATEMAEDIERLSGGSTNPDPPTLPPVVVPGAPDFSEFWFSPLMPVWRPHKALALADCDWVVQGGLATSTQGLGSVHADDDGGVIGHAFRISREAGHGPRVTFGVYGNGGAAHLGGWYGATYGFPTGGEVCRAIGDQWDDLDIEILGLDDAAEVELTWGGIDREYGRTVRLCVQHCGIRGGQNTYGVTANKPCGEIILDDFWMVPAAGMQGAYNAALHLANWTRLVLANMRQCGPGRESNKYQRHALYLKSSSFAGAETWVLRCDLRGGNQNGVHKRPGKDELYLDTPRDVTVIADCVADEYGWEHQNPDGGAAFSIWSAPHSPVFLCRNSARDVRYMGLLLSGQPHYEGMQRNWFNERGFPIGHVYVAGNRFSNTRSQRHCVSLNHTERVDWGANEVVGSFAISDQWSTTHVIAPRTRTVSFETGYPERVMTYDAALHAERAMTPIELAALAPEPSQPL